MSLPLPSQLLGLSHFNRWYPQQEKIVGHILDFCSSGLKYSGLAVPTGSGKSVIAVLSAVLTGRRTVILTATKGLQDQLMQDFGAIGLVNVKGQNNFTCNLIPTLRADEGPCHEGMQCPLRQGGGCDYYDQYRASLTAPIVVTNYAYYLAQMNFSQGLGEVGLLVCDEAHLAFGAMENYLTVKLSRAEVGALGVEMPREDIGWPDWQAWATESLPSAESVAKELEDKVSSLHKTGSPVPSHLSRNLRSARSTLRGLSTMDGASGRWVVQSSTHGYYFTPVWVSQYQSKLFGKSPKVVLMSAILSHKTLDVLGVPKLPDRDFISVGSSFPARNTPIVHVPSVRMRYSMSESDEKLWVARIDQIISRRLDRKGIIFTVSYRRRDQLLRTSEYSRLMMSHSTKDVVDVVRRFKEAAAPRILVSPAVTSGWDFPADSGVRYLIIGKVPYPDTSDPVSVARHEEDKEWSSFQAMDTLVQESGRATRSPSDKAEVLVVDDSIKWFMMLYGKRMAPKWYLERWRGSLVTVPDPLV